MEQFNITMRKYLKEVGVTSQQEIERVVREEKLAGKGKLRVKMILTGEGTALRHEVDGEKLLATLKAHVNLYNAGLGDTVRKACEFSVLLYP
jgi:uncharacterized protein DUF6494